MDTWDWWKADISCLPVKPIIRLHERLNLKEERERKFKNWMLLGNTNDQYQKENGKENKRWQRSILH